MSEPALERASAAPASYTPRHLVARILAARAELTGERKHVTILFADVTGSTALIQDLDPEEAGALLQPAVRAMVDAVHRYEGTVNRVHGEGIMALFGAPLAHEDHAVRACYAALTMQDAMRRYAAEVRRTRGVLIQIRVGLNSGEVVIREIGSDLHVEYDAVGPATHLAARMEQTAVPGTVQLAPATLALAAGHVQVRSLGSIPIKGLSEPIEVFELVEAGVARTRLQAAAGGLTRFVGRDAEMEALHRALDRARGGHGQIAALVGEPGVGKSRLVWELTHSHRTAGWLVLESGAVSYSQATPYRPVIDLLKAYCRIESRDDERAVREKLTGKLLTLDRALEPTLPALLALLDAPLDDPTWETLDPDGRRRRTLDALKRLLLRESREQPLLLVVEDLHWIDSETQALVDTLVDSLPTARILLLVSYRPEYRHGWASRGHYTHLRVDPLGEESAGELLTALLGDHPSLGPLNALLLSRTEGTPLFLEESVRSLVEDGALVGERGAYRLAGTLAAVRVPSTVQAVLAARIDRLPPEEKRLLQVAAVIGKDVPDALLRAVAGRSDDELDHGLSALRAAEFLYEASLFPELEYTFRHALTHEVAYAGLLQEPRRALHARVAGAIESRLADRSTDRVERLAHHASRGELWPLAATYCHQAGARAIERAAYTQSSAWLEQALAAVEHLPRERETLERAIDLRLELRGALDPLGRYGRMFEILHQAEVMATSLADQRRLILVTAGQSEVEQHAGSSDRALAAAERAAAMADSLGDAEVQIVAHHRLGLTRSLHGHLRLTVASLRRCLDLLDEQARVQPSSRLEGLTVSVRGFQALTMSELGDFTEAMAVGALGLRIAEEVGHPLSLAAVLALCGIAHVRRGKLQDAIPLLERGLQITERAELQHWQARIAAALSLAYARVGRLEEGSTAADTAVRMARSGQFLSTFQALLLEAQAALGDLDRAAGQAEDLLADARSCDRCAQAWMLRLLGEIATRRNPPAQEVAERRYRASLALATELDMRPLQARCHLGLGTLYRQIGRRDEAGTELSTAVAMLRAMEMMFWLPEAEAELAQAQAPAEHIG